MACCWKGTRGRRIAAIAVLGLVCGYNLALLHSFNNYEDFVLRESVSHFEGRSQEGTSLAFVPYYPNPDVEWECRFVPQPFLSRQLIEKEEPDRILVHHAFYHSYSDNKELLEHPEVRKMYKTYLLLRAGKLGYRESVRFTGHESGGSIFTGGLYKALWPDLQGLESSIYVKAKKGGG